VALTRQARSTEREWALAREGNDADRSAPSGRGRERGRVCGHRSSLTGGTHLSGDTGVLGLVGLGLTGQIPILYFFEF
jgi:hypothetical protein